MMQREAPANREIPDYDAGGDRYSTLLIIIRRPPLMRFIPDVKSTTEVAYAVRRKRLAGPTQEPTLEPEILICDPHHHFWDFRSERVPYQRYLLHELVADVGCGHDVRSTVCIEARSMYRPDGPVELRPVGEVEFVQGLAAASASGVYGRCRAAAAIIGRADLKLGDRIEPVLEALRAASPNRFRGIRHTVTWDPHPEIEDREKEGVLASADYRAGARVLARKGLSLDTGVCFPQLPELAAFAEAIPDLTIVLNHLGGLTRIGPYAGRDDEVLPQWRS